MTASIFARHVQPAHKAAARALGYTLHLGDLDAFHGLSVILRSKLSPEERWWLAWAVLRVCDDGEAEAVAEAVLGPAQGAGAPQPPFLDVVDDAAWWSSIASIEELRAYAVAAAHAMSAVERAGLLTFLNRARAA